MPCVLPSNFDTTLIVDLIDCKENININEEIKKSEEKLFFFNLLVHVCNNSYFHLKLGDFSLDRVEQSMNFRNSIECCDSIHILQWNPMEMDFLAPKNNYAYDEEDASVAIQGYSEFIIIMLTNTVTKCECYSTHLRT